ncbi:unnamed protein product [Symbiodinium sp. CCMP2592]|nr:unnamed protein product [Symbiodinium sp. CCMP2592]
MITGDTMCLKHREMMEEGLDGTAVYVCVKMYSRDLNLSQPPVKVASMAQIASVFPEIPRGVHAAVELSGVQIDTFTKLSDLADKYGMTEAAKALRGIVFVRRYDVHRTRDLHVLEVFSLSKTLVNAAETRGLSAESFDYMNPGQGDVLSETGFHQAIRMVMRLKEAGLMCIAPDCSSFSWACTSKTKRTKKNFAGDTGNPTVRHGNFMAEVSFFLFVLAAARGVYVCLENPVGSTLFSYLKAHILALDAVLSPLFFLVDRCAFVTERPTYGKRYKFLCLHPSHAVFSPCWFKKAVHSPCTCKEKHLPLMDAKKDKGAATLEMQT